MFFCLPAHPIRGNKLLKNVFDSFLSTGNRGISFSIEINGFYITDSNDN